MNVNEIFISLIQKFKRELKWNLISILLLSSISISASTASQSYKNDTLLLYGSIDYPPFEYLDDNGNSYGFSLELMKAIMNEMKMPYKIILETWPKVLAQYHKGKVDVIMGMSYSDKRAKTYKFGMSFASIYQVAIYRRGTGSYRRIGQLKGKKVLIEKGDQLEDWARENGLSKEIILIDNYKIALRQLSAGRADVLLCSRDVVQYFMNREKLDNLEMKDLEVYPKEYCYAAKDPRILSMMDHAFMKLKENGTYETIHNKWFTDYNKLQISRILYISAAVLLLCLIIFYLFVYLLRRKVNAAKRQLDKQSQYLKLAVSAGNINVWGFNIKKRIFFNVRYQNFPGKNISYEEELKLIHPDDRQLFSETINLVCRGEEPPQKVCFRKYADEQKDWQYIELEFAQIRDKAGNMEAIIGTSRDITEMRHIQDELKASMHKMEYAIVSSNTVLWELDSQTMKIVSYNEPLLNFEENKTVDIKEMAQFVHPDDFSAAKATIGLLSQGVNDTVSFELRVWYESEKKWHFCNFTATPFEVDSTGKVTKYVGFRSDVTHLIEIQHKLEQEKEKAQIADRLKSAFLANMSHEIRTPLNAIVGFSNMLQKATDENKKEEYVKIINKNNDLLLRLINDILDLSEIESGLVKMQEEEFNMADNFDELVKSMQQHIINPEVQFICNNPYHECVIYSDYRRISQILSNFCINAIKYTQKGHIKMGYKYEDGGIMLFVEDTGIGISETQKGRIFKRFEKLNDFAQGTGLGLSICKAITDGCNGKIGFTSKKDEGSTFWAWIPCRAKVLIKKEAQLSDGSDSILKFVENIDPKTTSNCPLKNLNILIAEDNENNYQLIEVYLKGNLLSHARNGQEAFQLFTTNKYDIILMDMQMPVMDGLTAIRHIRKLDKTVPIITITANAFDSDKMAALSAGSTDFMAKPIMKSALVEMIKKYIL